MRRALLVLALVGCGSVTPSTGAPDADGAAAVDVGAELPAAAVDAGREAPAVEAAAEVAPTLPIITDCLAQQSGAWTVAQCPNDCTRAICANAAQSVQLVGCAWTSLQADGPRGRGAFVCPLTGPDAVYVHPACVERCP